MYSIMIVLGIINAEFLEDDMIFEDCEPRCNENKHGRFLPADFKEKLQLNSAKADIRRNKARNKLGPDELTINSRAAINISPQQAPAVQSKGECDEIVVVETANAVSKDTHTLDESKITIPSMPSNNKQPLSNKLQKQDSPLNKSEQSVAKCIELKDTQFLPNSTDNRATQSTSSNDAHPATAQDSVRSANDAQSINVNIEEDINASNTSIKPRPLILARIMAVLTKMLVILNLYCPQSMFTHPQARFL
ncbi:uncharacterized protein VICG_00875 [Vittaforma corneae ATCC 50505]|uniref:Uncharacterized protein n=1 Tax=Vittaforma corneae (strain ATCC 50505) TaxID=993615 RepID=L2GMA7_VITCO|nr:uncharacterized protein VICG_00875 [Vittaforma corneae ATCC 50505]ELA42028.1 hypothetical protein VICG_00875 [Vittaforma corneae ATCC 50505]